MRVKGSSAQMPSPQNHSLLTYLKSSHTFSCHQTPSFPRMQDLQEGKAFSLHRGQETVVRWHAIMKRSLVGLLDQRLLFFPSMLCGVLGCNRHELSAAGMLKSFLNCLALFPEPLLDMTGHPPPTGPLSGRPPTLGSCAGIFSPLSVLEVAVFPLGPQLGTEVSGRRFAETGRMCLLLPQMSPQDMGYWVRKLV